MNGYRLGGNEGGPVYGHAQSRLINQRLGSGLETLSTCEDANEWSINAEPGATVTVTDVTHIDTGAFPEGYSDLPAQRLTPFAFSNIGPLPGQGNRMLKIEVTGGTASVYLPFSPRSFDPTGDDPASPLFYGWRDNISPDTTADISADLYTDTPGQAPYHRATFSPQFHFGYPGATWEALSSVVHSVTGGSLRWVPSASPAPENKTATGFGLTLAPSAGHTARVYVSGVFRVPHTRSRGAILLDYDDGFASQHDIIFPYIAGKGYRANIGIVGQYMEDGEGPNDTPCMTIPQMIAMQNAGFDMISHTWSHTSMGTLGAAARLADIRDNYDWLASHGITGRRFFMAPFNNYTRHGNEIIRRYHHMSRGRSTSITSHVVPAVRQHEFNSRAGSNTSLDWWTNRMAEAEATRGVFAAHMHGVDDTSWEPMTTAFFQSVIDAIANYDIDVLTWSDLYAESLGH